MGWDDVEKVIHHAYYNELRVAPEESPTLLVLPPLTSTQVRQKWCQLLFETFCVPAAYFAHAAVLNLLAVDKHTGLSVISGHKGTFITPVYCGHALDYLSQQLPIGGHQVEASLTGHLSSVYAFTTSAELAIVADIKKKHCRVALDVDSTSVPDQEYELPDGEKIAIDKTAQLDSTEILFNPSLSDDTLTPNDGLHRKIVSVVESCPPFMRATLYNNIVLSGGNTLFQGFPERLDKELKGLVSQEDKQYPVTIIASPDRMYNTWRGGAILSSQRYFPNMCISKEDYDEVGPVIADRLCW